MSTLLAVLSIGGALTVGAISPGPSFILVARTAAATSRRECLWVVFGLGSGAFLFAVAALLGLHAVLTAVPVAYLALKIGGGLYLLYLAWRILKNARQPLVASSADEEVLFPAVGRAQARRAYLIGLATQLSNPKTAIVFAGVFAALMPAQPSLAFYLIVPPMAFVIDAGWYALVTCALSSPAPRALYLRYKTALDTVAGSVMGLLGLKLLSMVRE